MRPERIVLHKFQEAIVFTSWGFLLLGSPMLVAYGLQANARGTTSRCCRRSWGRSFTFPAASGRSCACCSCTTWRGSAGSSVVLAALAGVLASWLGLVAVGQDRRRSAHADVVSGDARPAAVQRAPAAAELVAQLRVCSRRRTTDGGRPGSAPGPKACCFLSLLISNALFLRVLAVALGGRIYRASYSELRTDRARRRPRQRFWLDRLAVMRSRRC